MVTISLALLHSFLMNTLTSRAVDGGLAEYCAYTSTQVHRVNKLPGVEGVLVEPTSCAIQMLHRLAPKIGSSALVLGSGPAGIILAQLLKRNGAHEVGTVLRRGEASFR